MTGAARENRMRELDLCRLARATELLGETVLEPAMWPEAMAAISGAVSATGAALLQSDNRTPDIPRTKGVDQIFNQYFQDGWHLRDVRFNRSLPRLLRGEKVIIDHDLFLDQELLHDPFYNELLIPGGFKWFAGVVFSAGSALWALSIQRTPDEGPFTARDKSIFAALSSKLTEVASLATAVGRTAISAATDALHEVRQAAVAIDRSGRVLGTNQAAESLFGGQVGVKNGRIAVGDRLGQEALTKLLDQLRVTRDMYSLKFARPIIIRPEGRTPVVIHALPVHGAARTPFLGARAILTFTPLEARAGPKGELLSAAFGLTAAEAKLASLLAGGINLEEAADQIGIARATVRNQLKAVFAKTGTHRQGELVALVARL